MFKKINDRLFGSDVKSTEIFFNITQCYCGVHFITFFTMFSSLKLNIY